MISRRVPGEVQAIADRLEIEHAVTRLHMAVRELSAQFAVGRRELLREALPEILVVVTHRPLRGPAVAPSQ